MIYPSYKHLFTELFALLYRDYRKVLGIIKQFYFTKVKPLINKLNKNRLPY